MTGNSPYSLPKEPGSLRAVALAAAVHAVLFAFLWFGIHWQSQQPIAVEAEVWSPQIREAAPAPPEPTPQPTPHPKPEPVVQETAPPPKVATPPVPDPEIALEKEKKRKEREQLEKQQQLQQQLQKQQAEEERKDRLKAEAEQKAAAQEKQKLNAAKKAEADARKKQAAADAAAETKRRGDEIQRMLGQAAGSGAANSTGAAAQSQGPRGDPGYAQKVASKIKSNINFNVPEGLAGNPAVEFDVQLLPDGSVASVRLRKSSGVSGFDEAVKRAIERSAPYPKDKSGSVPSSFIGIHKPKDQ